MTTLAQQYLKQLQSQSAFGNFNAAVYNDIMSIDGVPPSRDNLIKPVDGQTVVFKDGSSLLYNIDEWQVGASSPVEQKTTA